MNLEELMNKEGYQINGFEKIYSDFILYALKQVCRNSCIFKFNNYDTMNLPCIGDCNSVQLSEKLMKYIEDSHLTSSSRNHELRSLRRALQEICHDGPILVCPNQIKVLDQKRDELTDIDGIGFGYKDKRLYLLIIEAKNQRVGGINDAKKQLLSNINEKLKISCSAMSLTEKDIIPAEKSVYCYIPINGEIS
jgi:hypothetical protein